LFTNTGNNNLQKPKIHSYCRVIALGYCVRFINKQENACRNKNLQKPNRNLEIDIEIENDIDIDIELILFPKGNNIFRNYVLRSIIRGDEALRGR
jgi:hypothetical protein